MSDQHTPVYSWRSGARTGGVAAQTAHAEFERIRAEQGALTATAVVDAARPDAAPLHPAFEWDDAVAAEEYRAEQARRLVRAVVVKTAKVDATPRTVYVHVPQPTGRGEGQYQPITVLVQHPDQYQRAFAALNGAISAAERALSDLRAAAADGPHADRLENIGIAISGFEAVRAAVELLRA